MTNNNENNSDLNNQPPSPKRKRKKVEPVSFSRMPAIFHLSTKETIIARYKKIGKSIIILDNPMQLNIMEVYDSKGKIKNSAIAIRDWIEFSCTEEYSISSNIVITCCSPDVDVLSIYEHALLQKVSLKLAQNKVNEVIGKTLSGLIEHKKKQENKDTSKKFSIDDEFDNPDKNPWKHKPRFNL